MPITKKILAREGDPLLEVLGLSELPEEEKKRTISALLDHFTKVVVETLLVNLSGAQFKEFKDVMENEPDLLEVKVTELAAQVPGLAEKIDVAVSNELAVIKAAEEAGE